MERKRIAFLDEGEGMGGAEINLASILKYLDKDKFNPLVVLARRGDFYSVLNNSGIASVVMGMPKFLSTSFSKESEI